jgi:hypothetical protein
LEVLPGKEIHVAIKLVVRWKEVLEGLDVPVGGVVIAAGEIVFGKETRAPRTIEIVSPPDVRGEGGQVQIGHLAGLEGELALLFPSVQFLWIGFNSRAERDEISARAGNGKTSPRVGDSGHD